MTNDEMLLELDRLQKKAEIQRSLTMSVETFRWLLRRTQTAESVAQDLMFALKAVRKQANEALEEFAP